MRSLNRKQIILLLLLSIIFLFSFVTAVLAANESAAVASAAETINTALNNIGDNLLGFSKNLFLGLAFLQLLWNCYQLLLEGKFESQSFVLTFCKTVATLIVFQVMVNNAPQVLKFISDQIAGAMNNKPGNMSDLIKTAFKMAAAPKNALKELTKTNPKCVLGVTHVINDIEYSLAMVAIAIADLIIIIAMFMAYVTALVTQAKLFAIMAFAILALGFSGSQYTRDIAINGLRTTLAVSVELLVIYALINASSNVFSSFATIKLANWGDAYDLAWQCVMAGIILAALFQQVPGVVSGMFGQGGGGGGNPLVGAAMVASAYSMAKSAGSMAQSAGKIAGSTVSGAGKVGGTLAGGVSAIKQHMPSAPPSISGSKSRLQKAQESFGRFSQGVKGAGKEAFSNRVSSMKEAFSRGVSNSADKILGRKHNDGVGKG